MTKHKGILNEDFQIVDYNALKKSDLVENLSYKGKEYNVSHNLIPQANLSKIKMVWVFDR